MKKQIVNQINNEIGELFKDFIFDGKRVQFIKNTDFGYQAIQFHEYMESDVKLSITLNIRFDDVEKLTNFYKGKFGLRNPKYFKESSSIVVSLSKIIGQKDFYLFYDRNLEVQLSEKMIMKIYSFFNNNNNTIDAEKLLYNPNIISYVEPILSFTKIMFLVVNKIENETIISKIEKYLNNIGESMSAKLYKPVFSEVIKDIQKQCKNPQLPHEKTN